jgi:peptide/nickel transport system substrate-binding protein
MSEQLSRRARTLVATSLIALACGLAGPAAAADRDLVIAVTGITTSLDPMGANSNVNERISNNVVEGLIQYDLGTKTYTPLLAESFTITDNKVAEFNLRKGVKCHNGEDFTAEDVAFSLGPQRFSSKVAPGWNIAKSFLGSLTQVEVLDPYKVRITSSFPDPLIQARFGNWMGQMICKDAYLAAANWEEWGKAVVGTGPYKVAEFKPGESIKLVAFDGDWGDKAPASSITYTVVPETAARVSGLLTGEYDIITEIVPDQFKTLEDDPNTEVTGGPIRNIRVILYDELNNPMLADPRIRQAMSAALDRQLIVDTMFQGRTDVPRGLQMEAFGDLYIADFQPIGYDPDLAKKLLGEAGYKGEEITYRYLQDYYTGEVATAQILQSMWKAVGLNVKLELKENWDQIEGETANVGRGVYNMSNGAYYADPVGQIWRLYGPDGLYQGMNSWASPEFDALGQDLLAIDLATRQAAMRKMLEIYERSDPPGTYLHVLPLFYGKRSDFTWTPTDTAFMDFRAGALSFP